MLKELMTGIVALIAQISGIISIFALLSIFAGAADGLSVLLIVGPLFVVTLLVTASLKGGFGWLFGWSLPGPY